MLIVGAKGFAKEVLQVLHEENKQENVIFFDDVSNDIGEFIFDKFPIIRSLEKAKKYFEEIDSNFTLGIGSPLLRKTLYHKFVSIGGKFTSTISPNANIGAYEVYIEKGVNLMSGTTITNSIRIEKGCLINLHCTIGHDTFIGQFSELSPGVHISGNCKIGEFCTIGTNATILPKISIGNNVTIGAGTVVTNDIPDNCVVVGVPGRIIKKLEPLIFKL